jgi:parallel beta-helix repeat protein
VGEIYLRRKNYILLFCLIIIFNIALFSSLRNSNFENEKIGKKSDKVVNNHPPNSSPSSLSDWWNSSYLYRVPINITNKDSSILPIGYTLNISINTSRLISFGKLRADGNDLRIAWFNKSNDKWIELDRINMTYFDTKNTQILFKTQQNIDPGNFDANYYFYYGCEEANNPPTNKTKIYDFYDDFSQNNGPAEGWNPIKGTNWTVINDEYKENETVIDRRTLLESYTVENASIEVRVKSSGGTNMGLGVMFRYSDEDNFYTTGPGFWDYEVGFGKWKDNIPLSFANTTTDENVLDYEIWYNLRIEILGPRYLVYLDDMLKNNATDFDHLNAGQIGFMTWTETSTSYFDDLKIKLLISNAPSITFESEEIYKESLIVDPIEIDENVSAKKWQTINQTYDWCTGAGTIDNPYIIENVLINNTNSEIAISIRNSRNIYFVIRNCSYFYSEMGSSSTGILLYNTNEGIITNNKITSNNEIGIHLHNSDYNNITRNIIKNNSLYGVYINGSNSKNNLIFNNHFIENQLHALDDASPDFNSWNN